MEFADLRLVGPIEPDLAPKSVQFWIHFERTMGSDHYTLAKRFGR